MKSTWLVLLALGLMLCIGFLTGQWVDKPSLAIAQEKETVSLDLEHLGHHRLGRNLLFSVYCDRDRGHLIYAYTVAGGESPTGNLFVIQGGCKARSNPR